MPLQTKNLQVPYFLQHQNFFWTSITYKCPPKFKIHQIFLIVHDCSTSSLTFLTRVSSIARQAEAEEWIDLVNASSSIFTRFGLAVVDVWVQEKGSGNRPDSHLIWFQFNLMYSAHVLFTKSFKKTAAIQILRQEKLVISSALDTKLCPCWWVHYHNSNRMWGEYKMPNLFGSHCLCSFYCRGRHFRSLWSIIMFTEPYSVCVMHFKYLLLHAIYK